MPPYIKGNSQLHFAVTICYFSRHEVLVLPHGPDTHDHYLVLRPLRRHPPACLGALVDRCANDAPDRLHPTDLAKWEVFTSYHHLVCGVLRLKVPVEVDGRFAPPSILSLQATRHGAPLFALCDIVDRRDAPQSQR